MVATNCEAITETQASSQRLEQEIGCRDDWRGVFCREVSLRCLDALVGRGAKLNMQRPPVEDF